MPETAQEAIAAGIHRHFIDTGDVPTDGTLALAQVAVTEAAAWLRAHASPALTGDPLLLASEWAARLLNAGLRDPYDEPSQSAAELLTDVPAPAADALLKLSHRIAVAEAERDELRATVARVRAVLNRSTYVDDFSRYVVTVDEVRAALRGVASDA